MTPPQRRFAFAAAIMAAGLLVFFASRPGISPSGAPGKVADNAASRYQSYDYGDPAGASVNFASQPVWVPTSTITELMRRDAILADDFARAGLTLRFHPFFSGADINDMLAAGKLAAGVGGDMPALTAAAKNDVVVASLVNQGFISIFAKHRMQLADLRGKRLGCVHGSSAHFALLRALAGAEVKQGEVSFVFSPIAEMPQALASGGIDAFAAWEPFSTVFRNANPDFTVIHRIGYAGYLYFAGDFAASRPEAAKSLIAAQLRAMAWMKAKRENLLAACNLALEEAKRFTGSELGISADEYAALVKSEFLDFVPVPIIPENATTGDGQLFQAFAFLTSQGLLPAGADWNTAKTRFDRALIREVAARPAIFRLGEFDYQAAAK
jgi:ABC-type taurine transport system substrate-binding protein